MSESALYIGFILGLGLGGILVVLAFILAVLERIEKTLAALPATTGEPDGGTK